MDAGGLWRFSGSTIVVSNVLVVLQTLCIIIHNRISVLGAICDSFQNRCILSISKFNAYFFYLNFQKKKMVNELGCYDNEYCKPSCGAAYI